MFLICLILVMASFPLIPAYFYNGRQYRNDNNSHNQQFQIFLYKWKITEKITGITENTNPQSSPYQIIHHKIIIMHFAHTCYKRSKCTDYRYKTGNNDGLSSVFFIKFMCFFQMTLLKYTGIGIIEKFISKKSVLSYNYRNRPAQLKEIKPKREY